MSIPFPLRQVKGEVRALQVAEVGSGLKIRSGPMAGGDYFNVTFRMSASGESGPPGECGLVILQVKVVAVEVARCGKLLPVTDFYRTAALSYDEPVGF
jgi:hypothetical protein